MMPEFPMNTCAFLRDLEANNSRDWFEANRGRYQEEWLTPAQGFVERMTAAMAALTPPHKAEPRVNGTIRRINRDVRFSKDKSPYNPRLHLVFWTGGHPNKSPALHLVLHPDRLGMGVGHWAMTPAELERFRNGVTDPKVGADLDQAITACEAHGVRLTEEALKRVPAGWETAQERETLLKRKNLVLTTGDTPLDVGLMRDQAALSAMLGDLAQVNAWLVTQLGET